MKKPLASDNKIIIPSSQNYLPDVDNFIESRLTSFGIDKSTIADIAISVTEMVINSIVHGNRSDTEKSVTVELFRDNSEIEIHISDEGSGFDLQKVENPIDEKNLLKEVGRGIFITKSLMDVVEFKSLQDKGSMVILKKNVAV